MRWFVLGLRKAVGSRELTLLKSLLIIWQVEGLERDNRVRCHHLTGDGTFPSLCAVDQVVSKSTVLDHGGYLS